MAIEQNHTAPAQTFFENTNAFSLLMQAPTVNHCLNIVSQKAGAYGIYILYQSLDSTSISGTTAFAASEILLPHKTMLKGIETSNLQQLQQKGEATFLFDKHIYPVITQVHADNWLSA